MTRLRRRTNQATENHGEPIITRPFSTASVKIDKTQCEHKTSAFGRKAAEGAFAASGCL
jgi:hypothetical protein